MAKPSLSIVPLSEMAADQEADLFVMMTSKEELKTRDGKPYYRVGFRDAKREVNFPIWGDSAWAVDCREQWMPGVFYKMRATLRESNYGPQLEIRKIREATDADRDDGFDPTMLQASSRYDPVEMFDELVGITEERIEAEPLRRLVAGILQAHRETLLTLPAATRNHHAYIAGYLEHVLRQPTNRDNGGRARFFA